MYQSNQSLPPGIPQVGSLIASLDFKLPVTLIPSGLINHGRDKLWWIQKENYGFAVDWLKTKGLVINNNNKLKFIPCSFYKDIQLHLHKLCSMSLLIWHQNLQLCNCFNPFYCCIQYFTTLASIKAAPLMPMLFNLFSTNVKPCFYLNMDNLKLNFLTRDKLESL